MFNLLPKDTVFFELRGEGTQAFGRVEGAVARVEQVARGVIDIEKDGVGIEDYLFCFFRADIDE